MRRAASTRPPTEHRAAGAPLGATSDDALALLRQMLRIRRFEEACAELYGAGKIRGFLHLCIGQEAVAAGAMPGLHDDDNILATYREHGHALARGVPMAALMAEMFGKREGCSRGRGGLHARVRRAAPLCEQVDLALLNYLDRRIA
ncbi:thiamine pyrophosphate-dependent enzyme [Aquincola sp. MAHUQ-54]|uniref:Thiamine pyrophosphate-dependent enzyme n=1 Tax=Aquincola agrisoli TaxID=3119538 RepID=A0AAW9QAS6_9BURK